MFYRRRMLLLGWDWWWLDRELVACWVGKITPKNVWWCLHPETVAVVTIMHWASIKWPEAAEKVVSHHGLIKQHVSGAGAEDGPSADVNNHY